MVRLVSHHCLWPALHWIAAAWFVALCYSSWVEKTCLQRPYPTHVFGRCYLFSSKASDGRPNVTICSVIGRSVQMLDSRQRKAVVFAVLAEYGARILGITQRLGVEFWVLYSNVWNRQQIRMVWGVLCMSTEWLPRCKFLCQAGSKMVRGVQPRTREKN